MIIIIIILNHFTVQGGSSVTHNALSWPRLSHGVRMPHRPG